MPITQQQRAPLFALLKTVQEVCTQYKLKPILTGSALIGIYRDNKLINAESIFNIEHETIKHKHIKLSEEFRKAGYLTKIYTHKYKEKLVITNKKAGVRVQILSFRRTPEYYYRRKRKHEARVILLPFYDNLGTITFQGVTFNCPADIEGYLAYLYNDWKTPAPDMFMHKDVRTPEYMGLKFGFKKWSEEFYEKHKTN